MKKFIAFIVGLLLFRIIKKAFIVIVSLGFLLSCLNVKRGIDGLYEYEYCLAKRPEKSEILQLSDTLMIDSKMSISGQVVDLKSREPILGTFVKIEAVNQHIGFKQLTDRLGNFLFVVQPDKFKINVQYLGYSNFETEISIKRSSHILIGMGESGGFITYGIKSKKRLTKWQLKQKAVGMRKNTNLVRYKN